MMAPDRSWLVLAGLALGVTMTNGLPMTNGFAQFAYGLMLPAMDSEMGWNYAQAGWLNTANALGYITGVILTMLMIRHTSPVYLWPTLHTFTGYARSRNLPFGSFLGLPCMRVIRTPCCAGIIDFYRVEVEVGVVVFAPSDLRL